MKRFRFFTGTPDWKSGLRWAMAAALVSVTATFGAVPQVINFQGILKDGSGNPVANASYSVVFTIYDAPTLGNVLWTETQSVTTTSGLFTVLLGSTNPVPDSAFNNPNRYLGVKVGSDAEMTPRQQLVSLSYSYRVNSVDGASGGTLTSGLSVSGNVKVGAGDTVFTSNLSSNSPLSLQAPAGTTRLFIDDANGFVGVGTTAPGSNLHVQGGMLVTTNLGGIVFSANHTGNRVGVGTGGPDVRFHVIGDGAASAAFMNGNVGIGTTSPAGKLHVEDANQNTDPVLIKGQPGAVFGPAIELDATDGTSGEKYDLISTNSGSPAGARRFSIFHNGPTASGHRLVIDPAGNVGIGMTSPVVKLDVAGTLRGQAALGFGDVLLVGNDSKLVDIDIANTMGLYGNTDPTQCHIRLGSGGPTLSGVSGKVGIGTASPAATLHVSGTTRTTGLEGAQTSDLNISNAASINSSVTSATGVFTWFTNASERMRLTNAGNVGIGTATPAALLHVNGTAGNGTGVWSTVSDRRLKKDIEPIRYALETVTQLQPVSFRWKDEKKDTQFGQVRGLIAQDVEKVIPEWIKTDPDGYKRLEPIGVDALLIQAIKEQQKQIEELRNRISELEKGKPQARTEE